jgi:formiminotetrahydrofolate cyclodeaminase
MASITVTNPAPGGGTSNAATFAITNPVPNLTSLTPKNKNHGGTDFTLTIHGTGFVSTSQVKWNGSNRATTFVRGAEVQAAITAADIANPGTAQVTVANPAPGGGTSNSLTFTIN